VAKWLPQDFPQGTRDGGAEVRGRGLRVRRDEPWGEKVYVNPWEDPEALVRLRLSKEGYQAETKFFLKTATPPNCADDCLA